MRTRRSLLGLLFLVPAAGLSTQDPAAPPPVPSATPELHIARATGPITVDGDLSDAAWKGAERIEKFWETNRNENGPPPAETVAWLAYDDRYFYAALELRDPDPKSIRAYLADRDNVSSDTDYAGVILDPRHDGKTGYLFLVNPKNIQYDAINSDVTGEDPSLDLFWDSAAKRTATGWTVEIRIPFSSLRYGPGDPQTWGAMIYRNYPRDFRYQMFSMTIPRGSNCFICHENQLVGLSGLPTGSHYIAAPYAAGRQGWAPESGLGSRLTRGHPDGDVGADVKWLPNADHAIDATINPDFSQVESDASQVTANERFALFFPEKRPFFLEGLDLLSTPLQVVYTRTITSPRWGTRATGRFGATSYTALVADDRGGGSVILPGPQGSSFADQDLSSLVGVGRVRRDVGTSFLSFLTTVRESDGGAYNRLFGPDFQWRKGGDSVTGQLLWSDTRTPSLPAAGVAEWDGRRLSSHAYYIEGFHSRKTYELYGYVKELGDDFRADVGFVPQVGYRETLLQAKRLYYPKDSTFRSVRPKLATRYADDSHGRLLLSRVVPGIEIDGARNSYIELNYKFERVRAGEAVFDRRYLEYYAEVSPSGTIGQITLQGFVGDDVDFNNARPGDGGSISLSSTLRPEEHLDLRLSATKRWLDVDAGGRSGRYLTAEIGRIRANYNFNSRAFLRLIGEEIRLIENRRLRPMQGEGEKRSKDRTASALLGYKLNWQTVLFLGFGDARSLDERGELAPAARQAFFKISYAFQR
ncbi:MAG TPA: DUF5916 domain-containing protein [Thermoanaerobaculia bacterium]|nr:DUF5916 domain-containing protein [Thermoanaerobaculia bacterium]